MRISDWSSDVCSSDLLAAALRERGWPVSPSQTNFLLVEFGEHTARIEQSLLDRGVVLRPMAGYGLPQCSRISVGSADENRRLVVTLDRSAERRVGKGCGRTCGSWWLPDHIKKKKK